MSATPRTEKNVTVVKRAGQVRSGLAVRSKVKAGPRAPLQGEEGQHNETLVSAAPEKAKRLVVRTKVRAGAPPVYGEETQHNETLVSAAPKKAKRLVVKTSIKAGGRMQNHSATLVALVAPAAKI